MEPVQTNILTSVKPQEQAVQLLSVIDRPKMSSRLCLSYKEWGPLTTHRNFTSMKFKVPN